MSRRSIKTTASIAVVDTDALYPTKNDLPESTRVEVASLFNGWLADAIDLQAQCKQAHWNVKGPDFIALHTLFDQVSEAAEGYVDLIAERIVQLGGIAEGTISIPDVPFLLLGVPSSDPWWYDDVEMIQAALLKNGSDPMTSTPEQFRATILAGLDKTGTVLKATGLKLSE